MATDEDEQTAVTGADNSLGRLLTLSDGVFAIAMTLLALDLRVPVIHHATNASLQHALRQQVPNYLSFLISFYVVISYWGRHRRLMRSVEIVDSALIGQTVPLLLFVAAMPFPAALLGQYGSKAISIVIYAGLNAVTVLSMLRLHQIVRTHRLAPHATADPEHDDVAELIATLGVFLLCIPTAYLFRGHGPWPLVLLVLVQRVRPLWRRIRAGRHPKGGDRAGPRTA
jgi:uncharacterized membrane protein